MRYFPLCLILFCLHLPVHAQVPEDLDAELAARINRQLEAILGPGKAQVTVQSQVDTTQQQSRSRTHSGGGVAAERSYTETSANGTRTRTERQYQYDQTETLRQSSPYRLEGRSIAVQYQAPRRGEEDEGEDPALDPAAIARMVKAMAGLTDQDHLDVQAVTFDTSAYDRLRAEMEAARKNGPPWWLITLIALGGIALGLGTGWWLARRRSKQQPAPTEFSAYAYSYAPTELPPGSTVPPAGPPL